MKKETLILLGLGAAALYFVMSRRRRGAVEVFSPEKISEEEFGAPTIETEPEPVQRQKTILQSVKDIAKQTAENIKRKRALKDVMFIPGTKIQISKKQFEKTIKAKKKEQRQKVRAESKIRRKEQRRIRRKKVGEISIMY